MTAPAHDCGACEGALRFDFTDEDGHDWFTCVECEQGHTSQACCCRTHTMDEDGCVFAVTS